MSRDDDIGEFVTASIRVCESPIEAKMLMAMRNMQTRGLGRVRLFRDYEGYEKAIATAHYRIVGIIPQAKIGNYRAGFLLAVAAPWGVATLVVECDGHEFHAAEDQQAIADKLRDRAMYDLGHRVCRFSGTDITREADLCAKEIVGRLYEARSHPI